MKIRGWLLLPLFAASLTGANCESRPKQAPFLCCILTCTGGLVSSERDAPEKGDAGWHCVRGTPIDYSAPCTAEDALECEDPNQNSSGGVAAASSSSSGGTSAAASSSSSGGTSAASSSSSSDGTSAASSSASSSAGGASS